MRIRPSVVVALVFITVLAALVWIALFPPQFVYIIGAVDGKTVAKVYQGSGVIAATFAPDGKFFASVGLDGIVKVRSVPDWRLVRTLRGVPGEWNRLTFSGDGTLIASVGSPPGEHSTLRLWSVTSGKRVHSMARVSLADGMIVAFSGGQRPLMAVHSPDGLISLVRLSDGSLMRAFSDCGRPVGKMVLTPDGKFLAVAYPDTGNIAGLTNWVILWQVSNGRVISTFQSGWLGALGFSPDGKLLVAGGLEGVDLRRVSDGARIRSLPGEHAPVFSNDGRLVALRLQVGHRECVSVWRMEDGKLLAELCSNDLSSPVQRYLSMPVPASFLPGGTLLLDGFDPTAGRAKALCVMRIRDGKEVFTLGQRTLLASSPDGKLLAASDTVIPE